MAKFNVGDKVECSSGFRNRSDKIWTVDKVGASGLIRFKEEEYRGAVWSGNESDYELVESAAQPQSPQEKFEAYICNKYQDNFKVSAELRDIAKAVFGVDVVVTIGLK